MLFFIILREGFHLQTTIAYTPVDLPRAREQRIARSTFNAERAARSIGRARGQSVSSRAGPGGRAPCPPPRGHNMSKAACRVPGCRHCRGQNLLPWRGVFSSLRSEHGGRKSGEPRLARWRERSAPWQAN